MIIAPALVCFTRTMMKKMRLTRLKMGAMTAAGIRSSLLLFHWRAKKARPKDAGKDLAQKARQII